MKKSLDWLWNGFEEIADAPNGVARLREMILSLAVQGRLVPQNESDEPACELLKRIKGEKARLVQEGKIRKSAPLPPVSEDEVPFEIPASWAWVRLGGVSDSRLGKMLDQHKNKGNLYPYLRNTNVQWLRFELNDLKQMRFEESELEEFGVIEGDLLVCEGGEPGRCAIWCGSDPIMFQKAIHRVRPFNQLDSQYILYNLLRDARSGKLESYFTGATIKHFTGQALSRYVFPLPPLAEQKRIVAKVDELMALCDELDARQKQKCEGRALALKATLARLERATDADEFALRLRLLADHFEELLDAPESVIPLRAAILSLAVRGKLEPQDPDDEPASVLLERITEEKARLVEQKKIRRSEPLPPIDLDTVPFQIPENWAWARFPELGEFGRGKSKHRPRNDPSLYTNGEYPLVQTGDVARANGAIKTFTNRYNEVGLAQSRLWPQNTLCITIAANIADSGILDFEACFPDSVVGFVPNEYLGHVRYFEYFLRTAKAHLEDFAPSTAQKNINLEILQQVLIPVPPLAEIARIVARVDELMALCDELEAGLKARQSDGAALVEAGVRSVSYRAKE